MKKYLIILLFAFQNLLAQDYCNAWDWIWTEVTDQNWMWKKAGGGTGTMYYFLSTSNINNISALDNISESEDYLEKNGWELLYMDFGCSPFGNSGVKFPYFILYNKYTGLLRVFTYLYNQEFHEAANGGIITLKFKDDSKITSLLTHTNKVSRGTSVYYTDSSPNDIGTAFLDGDGDGEDTFVTGYWCVAEFVMAFDHSTPIKISDDVAPGDYELYFNFDEIKESTVTLDGSFEFTTQTYSGNIDEGDIVPESDPETGETIKKYLEGASKVTKNLPSKSDLTKFFDSEKNEYNYNNSQTVGNLKFSQSYKFTMEELSEDDNEFLNFLLGVSKYSPVVGKYIGAAASALDLFTGKANSTPQKVEIMPTISKGNLKLSGTIKNRAPLGNITLELPGTPHLQDEQTPYYDCPLGIVGLEEEPSVELLKVNLKTKQIYDDDEWNQDCREDKNWQMYKSMRITSDLKIAINKSVNVEVIDAKAALSCIDDTIHWADFVEYDNYYYLDKSWCYYASLGDQDWYVNPFYDFLNNGVFMVSGSHEYSTPFIDIENFKNTSIFYSENAKVVLKILVVLKALDSEEDDTPIVFSSSYNLTEPTINNITLNNPANLSKYIFPFTQAQLKYAHELESDLFEIISDTVIYNGIFTNYALETSGSVTANPTNGDIVLIAGDEITFSPGFSCQASNSEFSFSTKLNQSMSLNVGLTDINIIPSNITNINSIITPYFEGLDCSCKLETKESNETINLKSFSTFLKSGMNSINHKNSDVNIFPNPAKDILGIKLSIAKEAIIQIVNLNGIVVKSVNLQEDYLEIDISDLSDGIYIIKFYLGDKIAYKRFIKN
jgi:hypothetical protein